MATVNKSSRDRWCDFFVILAILVVVIASKLPSLHTPYFWDEMGAYVAPSYWLSHQEFIRALPGLHEPTMFYGHPPALYVLVALVLELLGTASSGPHFVSIGFAVLGVCFTFLLGRHLYGRQVGIAAAALLFTMPLYFAQAGMLLGDIPVAALGVMTTYYFLTRSYPAFLASGIGLVMVKETGMAIIVAVMVYQLLADWREKSHFRRTFLLAVPLVPLAIFFAAQKLATGSFLPNPYFSANALATFSPKNLLMKGGFTFYTIFIEQFRLVLTAIVVFGLTVRGQQVFRRELILFGLIAFFFTGAFSVIFFLPRYSLPVLPYLAITAAASLFALCRSVSRAWMATTVCAALLTVSMSGNSFLWQVMHGNSTRGTNFETNMEYLNVVWAHKKAGEYLERYFPDTPVFAPWPLSRAYSDPYLGYVSKPLHIVPSIEKAEAAVFTEQSDPSQLVALDRIIADKGLHPLTTFERHGKSSAIYLLPAGEKK